MSLFWENSIEPPAEFPLVLLQAKAVRVEEAINAFISYKLRFPLVLLQAKAVSLGIEESS